jgi:hypothetical protein
MKFKAHEEKQQDDADLRDRQLRFSAADEAKPLRSDQCARDEIAQHRAKSEAAEEHNEQYRRAEEDHAFRQ